MMTFYTNTGYEYSTAWLAPYTHHEYVLFDVWACQDVLLGLYQNQVRTHAIDRNVRSCATQL